MSGVANLTAVAQEELENWSDRALLLHIARRQEEQIVALQDLQDKVAALEQAAADEHTELQQVVTEAQGLSSQVADLQSQVAAGGNVSTADIDALTNRVGAILDGAQSAVAQAKAGDPAGAAPTPTPSPPAPTPTPAPGPTPAPPMAEDRTLYTLDGDVAGVDATVWQQAPFVTSEQPAAPLYFFAGDTEPGHRNGDGVGGVWHAYDGSPVPTNEAGAPVEAAAGEESQTQPQAQAPGPVAEGEEYPAVGSQEQPQSQPAQPTQAEG